MKLSERDKKLLLILGALIVLCIPYIFIVQPMKERTDSIKEELVELNEKKAFLEQMTAKKDELEEKIVLEEEEKTELLQKFPSGLSQEKSILFLKETEKQIPVLFPAIAFNTNTDFGTVSPDAAAAANPPAEGDTADAGTESTGTETLQAQTNYNGVRSSMSIDFEAIYFDFKDLLKYIIEYEDRMVITDLDVSYSDGQDVLIGKFILNEYSLSGEEGKSVEVNEPELRMGSSNIFRAAEGTSAGTPEQEVKKADFFLMLSQPNADMDAKIFGKSLDGTEETYLISDKNSGQEASITFTGENGEYKANYRIGDKTYDEEGEGVSFTVDGAITFEVISSPRVGEDDKVGAQVEIINQTDVTVNVTVTGDDPENPRVQIKKKTGSILMK